LELLQQNNFLIQYLIFKPQFTKNRLRRRLAHQTRSGRSSERFVNRLDGVHPAGGRLAGLQHLTEWIKKGEIK